MSNLPGLIIPFRYQNPDFFGGIERKILTIAQWFYEHESFLPVLAISHPNSAFAQSFEKLGLPVHPLGPMGLGGIPECVANLENLVDQYDAVAIESHQFWESILGSLVRRRNRKIRHLNRIHTHIDGSTISSGKLFLYYCLDWLSHPGVDHYCVLSRVLKAELTGKSHIPGHKISVVRNGIPALGPFEQVISDDQPLKPVIACVGEIEPRKRQEYLIDTIYILKEQHGIQIRLVLVGGGNPEYIESITAKAKHLGIGNLVEFTGRLDSVFDAVGDIDLHVLPSSFEGIPTSIIEAMSIGKLVIATDVGGTGELIEDGVNGFLIPPNDPDALLNAILEVASTPANQWDKMRACARGTWQNEYSIEIMMTGLLNGFASMGINRSD
jgi:glycosyltransferase involved in cell wall biosynthesis